MNLGALKFLNTGMLLGIKPGVSKKEVAECIGDPHSWADPEMNHEVQTFWEASIWGYGCWCIWFDDDFVDAITASFEEDPLDSSIFEEPLSTLFKNLDMKSLIDLLKENSIDYYSAPKQLTFEDESGNFVKRRRRLADSCFYLGKDLEVRLRLNNGKVTQIAYPCNIISQAVGLKSSKLARSKNWTLVR